MPDKRGILTPEEYKMLLDTRVGEQWERVDSIVIGPGAAAVDSGWYNTWAAFAAADELVWFNGRSSNAGKALSNQTNERTDWAQDIHQTLCEFISPTGLSDLETDPNDGFFTPQYFVSQVPQFLGLRVILAESDEMTQVAASHMPSGFGTSYVTQDGAASPSVYAGNQGDPVITQGWKWPEALRLAAKSNIRVVGRVDNPARGFLQALPGPGFKQVPDGEGGTIELPNWYIIRMTMRGPRYLQLRGARTSA